MSLWSYFFPTPEQRLERARRWLDQGECLRALVAVETLEGESARALEEEIRRALCLKNLEEASALRQAGQFDRAREHLELAQSYGATEEELRQSRRSLRHARVEAKRQQEAPKPEPPPEAPPGQDDVFQLPPDHPRLRVAMALEGWPEELRARLIGLGAPYLDAAAALETGDIPRALAGLQELSTQEPAAGADLARALLAAGQAERAAAELERFGEACGHHDIGPFHTGGMLVNLWLQLGGEQRALRLCDQELRRRDAPLVMHWSRARVLEAMSAWEDAERQAVDFIRRSPRTLAAYKLAARCRLRLGERASAAALLEKALQDNCSSGRCGRQPFDPDLGRMLASIYLEDRRETERASHLLRQVKAHAPQQGLIDVWLDTLLLRNQEDPRALQQAGSLLQQLSPDAPLQRKIREAFPTLA